MTDIRYDILADLPNFTDEDVIGVPSGASLPPALPAASDLGLRFLQEILGSDQFRELAPLLKLSESELEAYRNGIQSLQLTALQMKLLGAIDESKLAAAPLKDLVAAFKILKDKELVMSGKPTEIVGLAGYLQYLEKDPTLSAIDVTPSAEAPLPNL